MSNKMLIDAAHPEETRVVVLRGNKVEEFDHESNNRRQLRGNIYLAKVTRVEPSLQAAFVDFGGNRHGFLAFNEIHPDYYQIPVADRQALLEEEVREANRAQAEEEAQVDDDVACAGKTGLADDASHQEEEEFIASNVTEVDNVDDNLSETSTVLNSTLADTTLHGDKITSDDSEKISGETINDKESENDELEVAVPENKQTHLIEDSRNETDTVNEASQIPQDDDEGVESIGNADILEEVPKRTSRRRSYKIQEVIKRRQIILVQVVKEERGTKGAALTTYLSLAGRYTVLMPNTARGGGISRKITNHVDRKRLRKIAEDIDVPVGMGLIIRTAGAARTKAEIKRDYEYLLRLWENVRDLTLSSTAPALVYEEGSLIKRSIRDLYSKEIDEVLVAGESAYREAKDFMRMLMPSHAKNVRSYKEPDPLFIKHRIERQLNSMFSPYVTLPSGGYIVINPTEALVSIDVNSGKATREHSIEETALKTNLEASEEISRQLRLRDLAGLVVIDFIDMDEKRNNRAVERRMKECLRYDRARIQIGRISHFGLMEMSRQRLRTGVLEGSTVQCPHCQGTGMIRSTESVALSVLRALEDTLLSRSPSDLIARTSVDAALYILNQKRYYLKDIEARYSSKISIVSNEGLQGANFSIENVEQQNASNMAQQNSVQMDWAHHEIHLQNGDRENVSEKKPSRNRRRSSGKNANSGPKISQENEPELTVEVDSQAEQSQQKTSARGNERRSRRRGRRAGRRSRMSNTY